MRYRSIALWPDSVSLGRDPNESTDTHDTYEQAAWVCRMLELEGLGGCGQIFPILTRVEPIVETAADSAELISIWEAAGWVRHEQNDGPWWRAPDGSGSVNLAWLTGRLPLR